MRAKRFAALPTAALLLAGGNATAQTSPPPSATPAQSDTAASKPAASQGQTVGNAGQGATQPPGTISAAPPATDQTSAANPAVKAGRDTPRSATEQDARYEQLVRAGYVARSAYPGQSTVLALFQRDPQYGVLARPIDVTLDHATVRQMAQVLTKVSGLPVGVDKAVPEDIRLTVDARGVPMATVLEAIANQAKLLIAPAGMPGEVNVKALQYLQQPGQPDKAVQTNVPIITIPQGIVLKLSPSLKIDDHPAVEFPSPTAPWSEEWFAHSPYSAVLHSDGNARSFGPGTPGFHAGISDTDGPGSQSGNSPFFRDSGSALVGPANGGPVSYSIASLGDHEFVVAEPAAHGVPAVLLTVYRLENGQLRRITVFVHNFVSEGTKTPRRQASGEAATPRPQFSQPAGASPSSPSPRGNGSPVSPAPAEDTVAPSAPPAP